MSSGATKYNRSADEAYVLSIVFTVRHNLSLQEEHLYLARHESCQLSCESYVSIPLGCTSVMNGLEFELPWLSEPSEPVSRMHGTKRRIEQFSVHTSCSMSRSHIWMQEQGWRTQPSQHVSLESAIAGKGVDLKRLHFWPPLSCAMSSWLRAHIYDFP